LEQQGLLREIEDTESRKTKKRYEITEQGAKVVQYFDRAKDLIAIEEIVS